MATKGDGRCFGCRTFGSAEGQVLAAMPASVEDYDVASVTVGGRGGGQYIVAFNKLTSRTETLTPELAFELGLIEIPAA